MTNIELKPKNTKDSYLEGVNGNRLYDVFYDIHGDMATAQVRGKNMQEAKKSFKKIYGGWKITNVQRVK